MFDLYCGYTCATKQPRQPWSTPDYITDHLSAYILNHHVNEPIHAKIPSRTLCLRKLNRGRYSLSHKLERASNVLTVTGVHLSHSDNSVLHTCIHAKSIAGEFAMQEIRKLKQYWDHSKIHAWRVRPRPSDLNKLNISASSHVVVVRIAI